jgi:WW domain-containing oxidoreductase
MTHRNPFGWRSTADQVIAGVDLTGKRYLVTGCGSGIGYETLSALAANGAQVIGVARTRAAAEAACSRAGPLCTPVACDLADLDAVAATAESLTLPLDAIIANAAVAQLPGLRTRYALELQFLVNHVGHFALLQRLSDRVREGTGRIVMVSGRAGIHDAPSMGIEFDNLNGQRAYEPNRFHGQSKLAASLYAVELARRVAHRGIMVNTADPGATHGTGIRRHLHGTRRWLSTALGPLMKSPQQGAATQTLLAASPRVSGITGESWANCQITAGHPLLQDRSLAERLWNVTESLVNTHTRPSTARLLVAA